MEIKINNSKIKLKEVWQKGYPNIPPTRAFILDGKDRPPLDDPKLIQTIYKSDLNEGVIRTIEWQLKFLDFPQYRGHTEKFDIISNLEVYYGRNERS